MNDIPYESALPNVTCIRHMFVLNEWHVTFMVYFMQHMSIAALQIPCQRKVSGFNIECYMSCIHASYTHPIYREIPCSMIICDCILALPIACYKSKHIV